VESGVVSEGEEPDPVFARQPCQEEETYSTNEQCWQI
jgi:hypothetical protein